jgi:hypothetical protein
MTDETREPEELQGPDPDVLYEAITSWTTWRVPEQYPGVPRTIAQGWTALGSDPVVQAHFRDGDKFRPEPHDASRRRQTAALATLLRSRDVASDRGGPPHGLGLTIEAIRAALREWPAGWPPGQTELTDYSARRVRQVLEEAGTDWRTELAAAETERER